MSEFERLSRDFNWRIEDHVRLEGGVWLSSADSKVHYPDEGYAICAAAEDRSFWFEHRNRVLADVFRRFGVPAALWEVGSGNGCVAKYFQNSGMETVAVEPARAGAEYAAKRGVQCSVCASLEELQLPSASIPAVGCFDVVEHLESPMPVLQEILRVLISGGKLLVTVPALRWLWSETDEASHHFQRYSKGRLRDLMVRAGFRPVFAGYMMMSLVMLMWLMRVIPYRLGRRAGAAGCLQACGDNLAPKSAAADRFIRGLLDLEFRLARKMPLPVGTSLVGLFEKVSCAP